MLERRTKLTLRRLASGILFAIGVTHPARTARGRLTVVTFHRVLPEAARVLYPLRGLVASPEDLGGCLDFFSRHYECGTLAEMADRHLSGVNREARPLLAITFDDGQKDNFLHARPALERRNMRASFFVPVESIETGLPLWHDRISYAVSAWMRKDRSGAGRALDLSPSTPPDVAAQSAVGRAKSLPATDRLAWLLELEERSGNRAPPAWDGMMTWEQIRELHRNGHEIGSHSVTHSILPLCSNDELDLEIGGSRLRLSEELGSQPETFCYPNGDHDARVVEAVRGAGYRWGVTTRWGTNDQASDPLTLRRCDIDVQRVCTLQGSIDPAQLAWRLSGLQPGLR
jgi:peptidoglycan/xylan/chitin deacetylase (PgdA/CDA1 family)